MLVAYFPLNCLGKISSEVIQAFLQEQLALPIVKKYTSNYVSKQLHVLQGQGRYLPPSEAPHSALVAHPAAECNSLVS